MRKSFGGKHVTTRRVQQSASAHLLVMTKLCQPAEEEGNGKRNMKKREEKKEWGRAEEKLKGRKNGGKGKEKKDGKEKWKLFAI